MSSSSKTSGSTATATKPQATQSGQMGLPHDKIAMRAYFKWQQRGCPCGTATQDWQEAEAELKAELTRGNSTAPAAKPAQQKR